MSKNLAECPTCGFGGDDVKEDDRGYLVLHDGRRAPCRVPDYVARTWKLQQKEFDEAVKLGFVEILRVSR